MGAVPGEALLFLIPRHTLCRSQDSLAKIKKKKKKEVNVKLGLDLILENIHLNTLLNTTRILLMSSNSYSKFVKQLSCAE